MKTKHLLPFITAFSLTAFTSAPVFAQDAIVSPSPAPTVPLVVSLQWTDIKDYTFDMRDQLFAGLGSLEARVDEQISELAAKREALVNANINVQAWDFTMKEMGEARTNLKSTSDDLQKAGRDTWDQMKDRVGDAWKRTQDAYAKVKASTTS